MEPKIDGARVVWWQGECYTRKGEVLSKAKGADVLRELLNNITVTLEGEWVQRNQTFWAFDLPDHPGSYDERRLQMFKMPMAPPFHALLYGLMKVAENPRPAIFLVPQTLQDFSGVYDKWKMDGVEGVVMKRRCSKYSKQAREGVVTKDWFKRRYSHDMKG